MKHTKYTVNALGKKEIRKFLEERHKLGTELTDANIEAWAEEAEDHANGQMGTYIEVRSFDTFSGHAEILNVSDEGVDAEEIDDGDDE